MAVGLFSVPTQDSVQYTLNASMGSGDSSLTLNQSVTGIVQAAGAGGVAVIDRVDTNGNKTPTLREYVTFTGVSGSQLTGLARGLAGSTAQTHAVGAIIEFIPDIIWAQALYDTFTKEHSFLGQHGSLASASQINSLNLSVLSNASIQTLNANIITVSTLLYASGASIVGIATTGGLNGLFQVPGGLASQANIGGLIPVPVGYTAQFAQFYVQTPASSASVSVVIKKNLNTVFAVGGIAAGATFGSTASIASTTLVAGDVLTMDINSTASLATDLSVLLRAT